MPQLQAEGTTAMGAAFGIVHAILEAPDRVPRRAWIPTLVLVSDGQPNDDWEGPLQMLLNSARGQRAVRLAVGIGADCDFQVLKRFVNHKEVPVVRAAEVSRLPAFFRFVTHSVASRSASRDPNAAPLPLNLLDEDELTF
jgi:uncharacterized protein YegL